MKKDMLVGAILTVTMVSLLSLSLNSPQIQLNDGMDLNADRIWVHFETARGSWDELVHNVVTNNGLNYTRNRVWYINRAPNSSVMDYLALANGTEPGATSTDLNLEIANCGLARAQGTKTDTAGNGNITLSYKWTSTCSGVYVNTTGTFNASATGTMFGAGTFTGATLQANDNITVNHNYKIS